MYYNRCRRTFMGTPISIRISEDLAKQLDFIARETDRPRSYIVQKALESYLDDYADLQIALDRLRDKGDEVISGKELRKKIGL
jgi:RHH-type rel operon transcriptional repressor/antitoxin RelB